MTTTRLVVLSSVNFMLFKKGLLTAVATVLAAAPAHAMAPMSTQMPKLNFDGAHNTTNWMPLVNQSMHAFQAKAAPLASWYGPGFHNQRTANGEIFNAYGLSAAHRSIPMGTRVRVTNLRNGRSVVLRINDYGPTADTGRSIDLSQGAAARIGMISSGVVPVRIEVLR